MKKYFLNDGTGQQGPFSLEELKDKNIKADTPVWYEGLTNWTTAGQLDELKDILVHTPPPYQAPPPAEPVKPAVTVTQTPAAAVTEKTATVIAASPAPAPESSKKKTAWLSWVVLLLVLGGVGYFVYQDMDKNGILKGSNTGNMKSESENTGDVADVKPDSNSTAHQIVVSNDEVPTTSEQPATETPATTTPAEANNPPAANTTKTNTNVAANEKAKATAATKAKELEAQKLAAQKLAAQKKAEDDKKKQQAAATAALAKEKEYRNNWTKYVTIGNLDIKKTDDGVDAFNVPVYNGTNATLDKVTLRVDYMKKEKKVMKSETVIVYGVPPGGGLNGRAPESRKGNNIKVFITGVSSRKLHFCFPNSNGNADDPYFCN